MRDLRDVPTNSVSNTPVKTQILNLDQNLAGLLCYAPIGGLIFSIIFFATEPKTNQFVRFHAMQSLALTVVGVAVSIVANILGLVLGPLGGIVGMVASLALLGACILCMVKAWNNEMYRLPKLGDLVAEKL